MGCILYSDNRGSWGIGKALQEATLNCYLKYVAVLFGGVIFNFWLLWSFSDLCGSYTVKWRGVCIHY